MKITRCDQFNLALSQGPWTWPGSYPTYFLCSDGETLSFEAAVEMQAVIRDAIIAENDHDGWRVVGHNINWESTLYCAHTGKRIPSACGEDDEG